LKEQSVTDALEAIARLGYQSAEIWMEHYWSARQRPRTIARVARTLGLGLTLHAASHDVNIISANAGIRRESRQQMKAGIDLAAALEASIVVVHPGSLSSSRGDTGHAWHRLEETVGLLDGWAAERNVWIGLENMERKSGEIFMTPPDIARIFSRTWKRTRLTLDLAHTQTHMDPLAFLKQVRPEWIGHVHLSDNSPSKTHLPFGRGELPVPEVLRALAGVYDGIVSLEGYVPGEGEAVLAHNMAYLREHGLFRVGREIIIKDPCGARATYPSGGGGQSGGS
jgi:sugar phosphate isomerase/epimerase